jgi:hypothetical protein
LDDGRPGGLVSKTTARGWSRWVMDDGQRLSKCTETMCLLVYDIWIALERGLWAYAYSGASLRCNILSSFNGEFVILPAAVFPCRCELPRRLTAVVSRTSTTPHHYLQPALSTSTPSSETRNTNPASAPTRQHSNRPLRTTSHRASLSASASSTLIPALNRPTSTRLTPSRVTATPAGQTTGNAGRKIAGETDCEVRIVAHESSDDRRVICAVSCADAAVRGFAVAFVSVEATVLPSGMVVEEEEEEVVVVVVEEGVARICHVKASMSSSTRACTTRCLLLWFPAKR